MSAVTRGTLTDSGLQSTTSGYSFAHVVESQTNRVLVVFVAARDATTAGDTAVDSVTYNGVGMTLVREEVNGGSGVAAIRSSVWILTNPPTGSHTVAVTLHASCAQSEAIACAFWGVNQTTPQDVTAVGLNDSNTTAPLSIVPVTGQAYLVGAIATRGDGSDGNPTPASTQSEFLSVTNSSDFNLEICELEGPGTPVSTAMNVTVSSAGNLRFGYVILALRPDFTFSGTGAGDITSYIRGTAYGVYPLSLCTGAFDEDASVYGFFDETTQPLGWFDPQLLGFVTATTLTATKHTNSQTFGSPTVDLGLSPTKLTNSQTFGTPVVTAGALLTATKLTNSQTFGSPTVGNFDVLDAMLLSNTQSFGSPTVTASALLTATKHTNSQTFGAPTVNLRLTATKLTNAQTFGSPSITTPLAATLLTNSQTFGNPAVKLALQLTVLLNGQTFGSPTVSAEVLTLSPTKLTNSQSFGAPTVTVYAPGAVPTFFARLNARLSVEQALSAKLNDSQSLSARLNERAELTAHVDG